MSGDRHVSGHRRTLVVPGLIALALPISAGADVVTFTAALTGDTDSAASAGAPRGKAALSLDTATRVATWTVEYSGLPGTARGLSCGALDSLRGPPIQQTGNLASPISGSKALNEAEITGLSAGRWVCVIDGDNDDAEIGGALRPGR